MSIGFIGAGAITKTVDVYSGGANRSVDTSLQNVLNKYDKIKTDIDRLKDQSQFNTYDITSRQYYNAYNKEAVNGWAETWYAEYRAVLALRADALQKKLQAAYNRVLDRSVYAEMKADQESVFAPYSNRTFKDDTAANLSNKMPISSVLLSDTPVTSVSTPTIYTSVWTATNVSDYLNNTSSPAPAFPAGRDALTSYTAAMRDANAVYHQFSETKPDPVNDAIPDWHWPNGDIPRIGSAIIPTPAPPASPVHTRGYDSVTEAKRIAQRNAVQAAIFDEIATWTVPTTEPELTEYNLAKDAAIEDGLKAADELWKGSVVTDGDDTDTELDDFRDYLNAGSSANNGLPANNGSFYQIVRDTVKGRKPSTTTTPTDPTSAPNDPAKGGYDNAYINPNSDYRGLTGGNFRVEVPMFGMGDLLGLLQQNVGLLPPGVLDTMDASTLENMLGQLNQSVQSFVGMQYDNIYGGNEYKASTTASSIGIYPYGASSSQTTFDINNQIDSSYPGGSVISAGITGIIPKVGTGVVIPIVPPGIGIYLGFQATVGPDLYYGHESAISNLSSTRGLVGLPTIGLGSASVSIGLGPAGDGANGGIIINTSFSYDILTDTFTQILKQLKKLIVESMTVNSYAASSGSAMDSYASRAEYHFTRPGFIESVKALNVTMGAMGLNIDVPIGDLIEEALFDGLPFIGGLNGTLGLGTLDDTEADTTYVNEQRLRERLFEYKHSIQGAESRETETGAFFATNAFLSQFEMSDMESTYWIGTQQNEELVDMDMARSLLTAGPEIIKTLATSMLGVAAGSTKSAIANAAFSSVLSGVLDAELLNIMYDLMYRDQLGTGSGTGTAVGRIGPTIVGIPINPRVAMQKPSLASEAYDYIEYDHKPFEGDSDFNYKQSGLFSLIPGVGDIMETLYKDNRPDFILDGVANTLRFTSTTFDKNVTLQNLLEAASKQMDDTGLGPRGHAGRGGDAESRNNNKVAPDGSIWADTPLGDINEVYTATRTVKFSNLTMGFDEFTNSSVTTGNALIQQGNEYTTANSSLAAVRNTSAQVQRYVGSDSRVNEGRYVGANPVNHETFTSNLYTAATEGRQQYDRRNQYSMSFSTKADSTNKINLFGSQALNPTIGGFIKMGEVDKNKLDTVAVMHSGTYKRNSDSVIFYEKPTDYDANPGAYTYTAGMDAVRALGTAANSSEVQKFGGSVDGQLNELNQTLYDHLHLRVDGSNLDLVKEYRDVFETGLMKSIFINGQSYHPSGGGITSAIEIRYDTTKGRDVVQGNKAGEQYIKTREFYDAASSDFDPYNTPFLTRSRGLATVYLNNYFSYKKRASNTKT